MDTRKSLGYASAFGSAPSLWRKSPVYLIVSLICCAMLLVACNTSASGLYAPGTLAAIKSRGELVIVTRNAPTTTFFDRSGHRTGFEHDLATSFAQYLGVKPRFLYVKSVHAMLAAVRDGRADLAAGAITRTTAREKRFRFGPTYAHVSQELVCNATHKPTTIGALAEVKRIVVPADSSYAERLAALKRKYPDVHLRWQTVRDVSTQQLLAEVADGLAGCTVTDSDVFAIDRSYHPRLQTMLKLSKPQPLAWPMPKDAHALAAAAARWLAAFKKSGKLKALKARYFQFLKPQTFADKKALVESVRKIYPRYAADFARAAKKYDLNKWLLAAQAYQESHWNPDAVSPTGVRGIMMLTQPAAHAVHATDPVSAAQSIMGGAQYMRDLERKLPA
ncbi:MAG: transporter substrate-binding domain-containing protein, partial [Rhodanobacteraceae bacterium]